MKKALLFLLLLISMSAVSQEKVHAIFVEGRNWRYEHLKPDGQRESDGSEGYIKYDYVLKVGNDVLFDGHQCKEIICDFKDETSLYAYGYEEDGCVMLYALFNEPAFYAPFPTGEWVTLYDFNVQKDSHCQMGAFLCSDMIVCEVGQVEDSQHISHGYISFSDAHNPSWPKRYVVEAIGSPFGLFEFTNLIADGSGSRFIGCYDGDTCLFSAEDFSLTMNISAIPRLVEKDVLHDLSGCKLQQKPSKGIYIKDGKKVLVK